jgi:steroid delta-isomerase-like uncharacterized protein
MPSDVKTRFRSTTKAATADRDLADASRRILEEAFNEGKFELGDELVAPDAVNHDPALPAHMRQLRGPDAIRRTAGMYRAAFPDLRLVVDDVIAADDKVVARWHADGTHRGEIEGLAPTSAHAQVTGISIDQWKDGKIVETWTEWDNLGLARQIGAAPPEGSVSEKIAVRVQQLVAWRMRSI